MAGSRISAALICGCSISIAIRMPSFTITLVSDFDQLRDHWVKKPLQYLTGAHLAPDGERRGFHRAR